MREDDTNKLMAYASWSKVPSGGLNSGISGLLNELVAVLTSAVHKDLSEVGARAHMLAGRAKRESEKAGKS